MILPRLSRTFPSLPEDLRFGTKGHDLFAAVPLLVIYGLGGIGQLRVLRAQLAELDLSRLQFAMTVGIISRIATLLLAVLLIGFLLARSPPKSSRHGIL